MKTAFVFQKYMSFVSILTFSDNMEVIENFRSGEIIF